MRPYWKTHNRTISPKIILFTRKLTVTTSGTRVLQAEWNPDTVALPSPGLDPRLPCLQVRTVVIVMAGCVYISFVGLCGYVNKFVDRSDEEGGFWYADQWQHPRVVTLAAEVAGRGWNCFSFCEVEAGTRRRHPLVEFFSLYEYIHLLMLVLWKGDLLLLVKE